MQLQIVSTTDEQGVGRFGAKLVGFRNERYASLSDRPLVGIFKIFRKLDYQLLERVFMRLDLFLGLEHNKH